MVMEQHLEYGVPLENLRSEGNPSCGFECNICLDPVRDPVVTLCGHLYCWPCIYNWIHVERSNQKLSKCPVCKACVTDRTLVPIYGRGQVGKSLEVTPPKMGIVVPRRPPSLTTTRFNSTMATNRSSPSQPMVGMFGEMVYAREFGNSDANVYAYPNSYYLSGSTSPRVRRHMMKVEQSLSRVCFFLCCCIVLCLLSF